MTRPSALRIRLGMQPDRESPHVTVLDRPPTPTKKQETTPEHPRMYRVVLYDDEYVDGMIVLDVLRRIFHKTGDEAMQITMAAHRGGQASVQVTTKEIAETRIARAVTYARDEMLRQHGYAQTLTLEAVPEDRMGAWT